VGCQKAWAILPWLHNLHFSKFTKTLSCDINTQLITMAAALSRQNALVCEGPAEGDGADFADTESYDSDSEEEVAEVVEDIDVSGKVPNMQGTKWMLTGRPRDGMSWDAFQHAVRDWSKCRYAAAQLEISANGKEHIQMYLQTKATVRATAIKKKFDEWVVAWHFIRQAERGGTNAECAAYCQKEDTRKPGCEPFQCGEMVKGKGQRTDIMTAVAAVAAGRSVFDIIQEEPAMLRLRSHLLAHGRDGAALRREQEALAGIPEAHDWQQQCLSHLLEQGDRKITWVWDPKGCSGKTTLIRHIQASQGIGNVALLRGGKAADLIHVWVNRGCPGTVIFDLARSRGHIVHLCELMENLKDGNVVTTKYDSRDIPTTSVRVLVLSNSPPPSDGGRDVWTRDRYDLWTVDSGESDVVGPATGEPWKQAERPGLSFVRVTQEIGEWYEPEFNLTS